MSHLDLECGRRSCGEAAMGDEEGGGACYSETDEGFHSIADGGEYNSESGEILGDDASDNGGVDETMARLDRVEKDCRICHLSLVSNSPACGVAIELGCSCKDDLAAAHKHCAETWFKIKGNKTCEICNSIACNVVGPNDIESSQQAIESNAVASTIASAPTHSSIETRTCLNGHRLLNFLLACMVFAFVISWLFHFNIPS